MLLILSIKYRKRNQEKFKSYLGEIKKGSKKSKEQKNTIYNIEMLYKARKDAIKFFDDYSSMMSEAKTKARANSSKITNSSCTSKSW